MLSLLLYICFAAQTPEASAGNSSINPLSSNPSVSQSQEQQITLSYPPVMNNGEPRFIDDSTHTKNLACVLFCGPCIDCIAGFKDSCLETLLCCPFKNAPSIILDPLCALYWCCTSDSTPPRMRRSLNILVTDCKGKPFYYRRASSTDKCCCPSEEIQSEDEKELTAFYAWRQTQTKQMT